MFNLVIEKQKSKKFIFLNISAFIVFFIIFTLVDHMNTSYLTMKNEFNIFLPILNIFLNIIMSIFSALMIGFSSALLSLTGKNLKGSNLSFVSIVFGMFTYGCSPCLIAFFATIGITLSIAVLPLAGLPYKFISLLIVSLGFIWLIYQTKKIKCSIKSS